MAKLVKLFLIFGPVHGTIKVIKKYANPGQHIDESLMSTLCLPSIELLDEPPSTNRFQTFLVTKEDGQVLYGSGLIVYDRHHEPPPYPGAGRYASYCYAIITETPFINATRTLLELIWKKKCDSIIIRAILNIPLPARRKCLRIVTPPVNQTIGDIYLYRGMNDLPLLDYPLRELFDLISIDDFLLAYACILLEFRTLIISQDNYKLMMVGETLTSLLLPLKWCNVYVPILPPVYGATYLDAPTSYIMGINTKVTELPDNLNHIQCRIYCDENRVVCDADSLTLPLFLNDIKRSIIDIMNKYKELHQSPDKPMTYLDELKFNRAIRVTFIKTIKKNVLANYQRYIVDVPESSADIRQFDVVSYLSDQSEFMRSFLSKFLETQLFASFVDENAKRMQQSWLSIYDMDPEELSDHFSDKALEQAFEKAQRIHLMDLRQEHLDIEVKTVPASPLKLRRRMPALSAIANRLAFGSKSSKTIDLEQSSGGAGGGSGHQSSVINSSPPIHRNSVATVSLEGHLSHDLSLSSSEAVSSLGLKDGQKQQPPPPGQRNNHMISNGKIIELINEVKLLTKSILNDMLGDHESNGLVGSLCDLIERVWAHGSFTSRQDIAPCCALWKHLQAFARLKYLDNRLVKDEFIDGSNLNILSTNPRETNQLDMMFLNNHKQQGQQSKIFNWFRGNMKFDSLTRDLLDDLKTILLLRDVKTDVGKARAFIKLSLERKKLSKHLKTLISDQALLHSLYKPYAFLRCEEEREQFLMYLLTLNAVDLPCFTSTFVSVINARRINQ